MMVYLLGTMGILTSLLFLPGCGSGGGTSPVTIATATPTATPISATPTPTPTPTVTNIAVTIDPTTASLTFGGTQSFAATVANSTNQAVTWQVTEGTTGGTITSAGVYTAPSTAGTYHVVATSSADISKSATATVTVQGGSGTVILQ